MKKAIFIFALLLPSIAMAEPFNGPYVGAQGGYDSYHIDTSGTFTGFTGSADFGGTGGVFGLFAGYGKTSGNTYVGAAPLPNP